MPRRGESRLRLRRAIRDLDTEPSLACELIESFAADDPDARGTVAAASAIAMLERRLGELKGRADAA